MTSNLDGMYWNLGDFSLKEEKPQQNAVTSAIKTFKKSFPSICTNIMAVFENGKANLVQTEMIIHGVDAVNIEKEECALIRRLGQTASRMCELMENQEFSCSSDFLEVMYQCLTMEKKSFVSIKSALEFLNDNVKDKKELAVAAFLYLCKEKPCPKYNELLAMLFMNGILLNDGFSPLWIKERDKTEFKIRYLEFERSHQASDLMHYLVKIFQKDTKRHLKLKRTKDKPKKPLIFF